MQVAQRCGTEPAPWGRERARCDKRLYPGVNSLIAATLVGNVKVGTRLVPRPPVLDRQRLVGGGAR